MRPGQPELDAVLQVVEGVVGEGQRRSKLLHQLLAAAEGQKQRQASAASELARATRHATCAHQTLKFEPGGKPVSILFCLPHDTALSPVLRFWDFGRGLG